MSERMRTIHIREPGPADVLEIVTSAPPDPGPGGLLVRVATSGVNRADLLQRLGRYPAPEGYPQDVPGLEFSGVVDRVGPDVQASWRGRAVMGIVGGGAYASHLVVRPEEVLPTPAGLDGVGSGAIPEAFVTAYDALTVQGKLRPGETVLVHAVGSGVGTAAVQLARRAGARVLGTSRTADKLDRAARLGLEHGVLADDSWVARVMAATGGDGVDVVLDLVGAAYLDGNQRVLAPRGRHVVVGIPGGSRATLDLGLLMRTRATLIGTVLRSRSPDEKVALTRAFERDVIPGFEDGSLRPVVDRVFPAEEAADAHRYMEGNRNFGKILLAW